MRILISAALVMSQLVLTTMPDLSGQGHIPEDIASRTEEYSKLSTYPAACFKNAWMDFTGRLLIVTCPPEASDGMHMFSFDGYEFKPIRHTLDSLPANSKILTRLYCLWQNRQQQSICCKHSDRCDPDTVHQA